MSAARHDPFDLQRFLRAQEASHALALGELRAGRKQSHWMWYVLPQLRGLGSSANAAHYGIGSAAEAAAYLAHPVLGVRLHECVAAICTHTGHSAREILGPVDADKFRSCLTLFLAVAPDDAQLQQALDLFFGGAPDARTLALLRDGRR